MHVGKLGAQQAPVRQACACLRRSSVQAALAGTRLIYILRGLWKFLMPRAELLRASLEVCRLFSVVLHHPCGGYGAVGVLIANVASSTSKGCPRYRAADPLAAPGSTSTRRAGARASGATASTSTIRSSRRTGSRACRRRCLWQRSTTSRPTSMGWVLQLLCSG